MANAYLEIILKIAQQYRPKSTALYQKYKQPFLDSINSNESKTVRVLDDDIQVLRGFDSPGSAEAYLNSELFNQDVVSASSLSRGGVRTGGRSAGTFDRINHWC